MIRERFIMNLVEDGFVRSAIMYTDHSDQKDKVTLYSDKYYSRNSQDYAYGRWFINAIDNIVTDYMCDNQDLNVYFNIKDVKNFESEKQKLKDDKNIHMFKTVEDGGILKEYSDLFNEKDLVSHASVGIAVIDAENNKILMLDHIKCDMLTIPVGKVDEGETPFESACKELKEETNLEINKALRICQFTMDTIKNDKLVIQYNNVFLVDAKDVDLTQLKNMEPNKHRDLFWMDIKDLLNLKTKSYMTNVLIDAFNHDYIITDLKIKQLHTVDKKINCLAVMTDGIERTTGIVNYTIKCKNFKK